MYKYQLDKVSPISWNLAKKCALIAVDELIEFQEGDDSTVGNRSSYWNEVRTELEKL